MPDSDPIAPLVDAYEAARDEVDWLDRVYEVELWKPAEARRAACHRALVAVLPVDSSWYTHPSGRRYRAANLYGRGLGIVIREPGDDRP